MNTHENTPKLCECGCGQPIAGGYRFLRGHNSKYPGQTPEQRFWKYVTAGPFTDCWEWQGAKRNGYGVLNDRGKLIYAHRLSYELHFGALEEGQNACHACDNRPCVNPTHLFAGTQKVNLHDMTAKGRHGYGGMKGESHHQHKLTSGDILLIRTLSDAGVSQRAIARRFAVSQSQIGRIIRRESWSNIP